MIEVYTDGSYFNDIYSGAYVVMEDDNIVFQDSGIGKNDLNLLAMRNISGELSAVMHATYWLMKNNKTGIIIHDYNGISKWVLGEWKTNRYYTALYKKWMQPKYKQGIITFKQIKGHSKVAGNEIADKLAQDAIRYYKQWSFE